MPKLSRAQELTGHPVGGRSLSDAAARLPAEASRYSRSAPAGAQLGFIRPSASDGQHLPLVRPFIAAHPRGPRPISRQIGRPFLYHVWALDAGCSILTWRVTQAPVSLQAPPFPPACRDSTKNGGALSDHDSMAQAKRARGDPSQTRRQNPPRHQAPSTRTSPAVLPSFTSTPALISQLAACGAE